MKAYYGSRFSPNMTRTPEGFLICHNVPIARTGWYEYLGEEIGASDKYGQIVKVYRSPEEVFSPAAMASFEGKVTTDEHPSTWVMPDNVASYLKGTVKNVHRGEGNEADLLIADLVIYDPILMSEVESGKREVSCGYDCIYEENSDGTYSQRQICGNHVAVVKSGRAGDRVAIKDSKINSLEGEKRDMGKKITFPRKNSRVTDILAAIGLKHYATDAEPEEIMDAVNAMAEEKGEPKDEGCTEEVKEAKKSEDEQPSSELSQVLEAIKGIDKRLSALEESDKKVHSEINPEKEIDAAIADLESQDEQLEEDSDNEESVTIDPEQMNDEEGPVATAGEKPVNPIPGADNAYKIAALKAIKPIIAAISDPVEKRKVADAAMASIKSSKPSKNTYASIAKGQKKAAKDKQSKETQAKDHSQLGIDIAKKYNPHYKNR